MTEMKRWKKKVLRFYCRVVREKATPEYIARGWAIGMFFGCLLPFGTQLMFSVPCSFILKGSKLGATVGTLITNHFSIFVIYPAQCYVGNRLLGGELSHSAVQHALAGVLKEQSFEALWQIGWNLVAAFFLGGILLTAVMTPLTYFGVLKLVKRYRQGKTKRIAQ